jgi:hypothetical protein
MLVWPAQVSGTSTIARWMSASTSNNNNADERTMTTNWSLAENYCDKPRTMRFHNFVSVHRDQKGVLVPVPSTAVERDVSNLSGSRLSTPRISQHSTVYREAVRARGVYISETSVSCYALALFALVLASFRPI